MAKVSKRILDEKLKEHIYEIFLQSLVDLKNPSEAKVLLEDLLSPVEKIMLTKRLAIAFLLDKGYSYSAIDGTLKVSRGTIMNVSYSLKHRKNGGYKKVIEKIRSKQKREDFMDRIEEILIQLSPPKMYGGIGFERKQKEGKRIHERERKRNLI